MKKSAFDIDSYVAVSDRMRICGYSGRWRRTSSFQALSAFRWTGPRLTVGTAGGHGALLLIIRTALEDRTLLEELNGYKEYGQQVRYRLLPGIW